MSEVHEVVLTTPFGLDADHSDVDAEVVSGLLELGFRASRDDGMVWHLDGKLHYYASVTPMCGGLDRFGIDGLRALVLALPWRPYRPGYDLEVLWWSDTTTIADDGWAGRSAPYAWTRETWEVR